MTPTTRHLLAWTASLLVFSVLGYFVWQANYAAIMPSGTVEAVNLEVTSPPITAAAVEPISEQPVLKQKISKPKPRVEKVLPKTKTKPVVVAPTEPEESSPVEEPKPEETADAQPPQAPEPPVEEATESQTESGEQASEQVPEQAGDSGESAAAEPTTEGDNTENSAPPKFGTPGTMLNETQLTVMPGNKQPSYPWMSRIKKQEGTVVLKAYIRENGTVDMVSIYQSSGHAILDKEAAEKYFSWKYNPGKSGWVLKPFKFSLKE